MLGVSIAEGALFYGKARRRERVYFTQALRSEVEEQCRAMHAMVQAAQTPAAQKGSHCRSCSLARVCMPSLARAKSVKAYLQQGLDA